MTARRNALGRAGWVARIGGAWAAGVAAIIATGQALIDAKAELPHGAFANMVESDLPFGPSGSKRVRIPFSDYQYGLLIFSAYAENMTLKLMLILDSSLLLASTKCASQEGKIIGVPFLTFTTT